MARIFENDKRVVNMKKVYFISYSQIKNQKFSNSFYGSILDAAKELSDNFQYYFAGTDFEKSNVHRAPKWLQFANKCFMFACSKLKVPYYYSRTLSESLFDIYYAYILRKETAPYTLFVSMYAPKSCSVAKKRGNNVALFAGNHDDNLYYDVVKKEKKRLSIDYTDVYDSEFRNAYYNRMLDSLDTVISANKLVAELYPARLRKILIKNTTTPLGYSSKKKWYNGTGTFTIGYIGHTVLLKGLHLLVEAIDNSKYKKNIKLRICGPVNDNILPLIKDYSVKPEYLGFIPNKTKNDFYKSCDLIVVPSLYDAGPTVVMEAGECNVPIILSSGCGWIEYFDGMEDRHVFKTGQTEDLKKLIENCIENYPQYIDDAKQLSFELFNPERNKDRLDIINLFKLLAE